MIASRQTGMRRRPHPGQPGHRQPYPRRRPRRAALSAALGLAALLAVVSGCTTLPAPEAENDTALAIPVTFEITDDHYDRSALGDDSPSGYYLLAIRRVGDGVFYRAVRLYAGSGVKIVTGIPPGEYYFDRYRFHHKRQMELGAGLRENPRGEGGPSGELEARFSLRGGEITVSPLHFHITMDRIGEERYDNRLSLDVRETAPDVHAKTVEAVSGYESFPRWSVKSSAK